MSDYLKDIIMTENYINKRIQDNTIFNYELDKTKKQAMIDRIEKGLKMTCFCHIDLACPCPELTDMLEKNGKCKCGFIKKK